MARHLAVSEAPQPRWWKRRWLSIPVFAWLIILALSLTAVAAFLSKKESAPDNWAAAAVGQVDIDTATTNGLFVDESLSLQPGATHQRCFAAVVDGTGASGPGNFKLYTKTASGTLAPYLTFKVEKAATTSTVAGGQSCTTFPTTGVTTLFDGTLAGFGTTHTTFTNGAVIGAPPVGVRTGYLLRFTLTLPDNATTQAEASGKTASLALVFHNE